MKRAILSLIAVVLFAVVVIAQPAQCRVNATIYKPSGAVDDKFTLTVFRIVFAGQVYSNQRQTFRTNSSGVLLGADGSAGVSLPQGSVVWIYANAPGFDHNPNSGTAFQIPNTATAQLTSLASATTVFRALGDLVYGGVDGIPTRLPAGANGRCLVMVSGIPAWTVCPGGGGSSIWGGISGTLSDQTDLQAALDAKAALSHTHSIANVTGLQTALDGKAALSHTHTASEITDSTTAGRDLLTAADVAAQRTALGLGTAALLNVAASGNAASGEVVKGDDTRLTDARTPTAHTHAAADTISGQFDAARIPDLSGTYSPVGHTHPFASLTSKPTTLSGYGITDAQPLDQDLTDIAALTGDGLLRKNGGVWGMDSASYLTGNQTITLSGDLSGSGATSISVTIANNAVTNAKLAQVATATFKGRTTAGTGNVEDLSATQATALLNVFVGDSGTGGTQGLVPAPVAGDSGKFLRGDGVFATVSASTSFGNPTATVGLTQVNGSASTAMRSDAAPALNQGITPTWSGAHIWSGVVGTGRRDGIGTTSTDGWVLENTTAAVASGATVQYSPRMRWRGTAWSSGSSASHNADWIAEVIPTTAAAISSEFAFKYSLNGSAYVQGLSFLTNGLIKFGASNIANFGISFFGGGNFSSGFNDLRNPGNNNVWAAAAPPGGPVALRLSRGGSSYYTRLDLVDSVATSLEIGTGGASTAPFAFTKKYFVFDTSAQRLVAEVPVLIGPTTATVTGAHTVLPDNAATNAIFDVARFGGNSTGTAAAGFGGRFSFSLESSTTNDTEAARLEWLWTTATHASRTSAVDVYTVYNAGTIARNARFTEGRFTLMKTADADPTTTELTSLGAASVYVKNSKLVFAYNNAGTITYVTIPLDGSTTTWTHSTTAP